MTTQHPNLTAQSAVFYSTHLELGSGAALPGRRTFSAAATADQWQAGDTVSVHIRLDDDNVQLWRGIWDPDSSRITPEAVEFSTGTIANGSSVACRAVLSRSTLPNIPRRTSLTATDAAVVAQVDGSHYLFTPTDAFVSLSATVPPSIDLAEFAPSSTLEILPPTDLAESFIQIPPEWQQSPPTDVVRLKQGDAPIRIQLSTQPNGGIVCAHDNPDSAVSLALGWYDPLTGKYSKDTLLLPLVPDDTQPEIVREDTAAFTDAPGARIQGLPADAVVHWEFDHVRADPAVGFDGPILSGSGADLAVVPGDLNYGTPPARSPGITLITARIDVGAYSKLVGPIYATCAPLGTSNPLVAFSDRSGPDWWTFVPADNPGLSWNAQEQAWEVDATTDGQADFVMTDAWDQTRPVDYIMADIQFSAAGYAPDVRFTARRTDTFTDYGDYNGENVPAGEWRTLVFELGWTPAETVYVGITGLSGGGYKIANIRAAFRNPDQ